MHKRLVGAMCVAALGAAPLAARPSAPTHVVYVTALAPDGRLISGLTADDFDVFEDGRAREVISVEAGPHPVAVAATLELFGLGVQTAITAAASLERALAPGDRAWLSNLTGPGVLSTETHLKSGLIPRSIESVSVFDGLFAVLSAVPKASPSLATLAITAPEPDQGPMDFDNPMAGVRHPTPVKHWSKDVETLAIANGVAVYGLSLKGSTTDGPLRDVTDATGGGFVKITRDVDIDSPIAAMLNELRYRYRVTFSITPPDGKTHDLRLRSKRTGVRFVAPKRFVATS